MAAASASFAGDTVQRAQRDRGYGHHIEDGDMVSPGLGGDASGTLCAGDAVTLCYFRKTSEGGKRSIPGDVDFAQSMSSDERLVIQGGERFGFGKIAYAARRTSPWCPAQD